jgi:hypothetical protein
LEPDCVEMLNRRLRIAWVRGAAVLVRHKAERLRTTPETCDWNQNLVPCNRLIGIV